MPGKSQSRNKQVLNLASFTFSDLLPSVDFCNLFVQKLVAFLTYCHNLFARNAQLSNVLKNLLRDGSGTFVLGEGIWIIERVV